LRIEINMSSLEKVFITGGAGFIGSHLIERLATDGAHIEVLVRGGFSNIQHVEGSIELVKGDMTTEFSIDDASTVFHFAAFSDIRRSIENPRLAFGNTQGTFNLLESIRRSDTVEKLVYLSTSHVYGIPQYLPIDENHPTRPREPYSASKLGCEALVSAYSVTYGIPAFIGRLFPVYGPRQKTQFVVPHIITQMLEHEVIEMRNPTNTLDFTYIDDVVDGLLLGANRAEGTYNIGSGIGVNIKSLVTSIADILTKEVAIHVHTEGGVKYAETERMLADIRRMRSLGWKPKTTLAEGLKRTVEWYEAHRDTS